MTDQNRPTGRQPYLLAVVVTSLVIVAALTIFNYLIDPYYIHQWDTPLLQRPSPPQQKIVPWAKTYAAAAYQPEVVYLGSSRTEIGLPANSEVFKGKRVLNLAISGAALGDAINMLNHTSTFHRPEIVIWGLDYGWQFRQKSGNSDFTPDLVAAGPSKRFALNLKRSLSLNATTDAYRILFDPEAQRCEPILATHGTKPDRCLDYIMADEGGTFAAFDKIINRGDPQAKPADVQAALHLLDNTARSYCAQGTTLRFFLHPVHALAELSYWENNWQDLDRWKQELVSLFDTRRQEGCDIRLLDFSGYNAITTEAVPQKTGEPTMQHYWEHSHYRAEVGQIMLKRMFDPKNAAQPGDFGAELTSATIEQHLLAFQRNRDAYCQSHPSETAHKTLCRKTVAKD